VPEQYGLSMIFLQYKPNAASVEEIRQQIAEVREEILAGKDFAEAAQSYSECPSSANGGNLGNFSRGTMYKSFEDVAFSLDIGEISQPVRTPVGYHLIEVLGKNGNYITARHILLKVPITEEDKKAAETTATDIQVQVNGGNADFAEMVETHSDDEESRKQQGNLGLFVMAEIPPQFAPKIQNLAPGQVSSPIVTDEGVYLLRLNEIKEAHVPSYEELKPQLRKAVLNEKTQQQYQTFIENLKKKIYMRKFI